MIDIEHLLPLVEKPSRYIDHEINACRKCWNEHPVRMLFAFPDLYELGISHLGLKILYSIVNALPYALADRMYLPWLDLLRLLEEHQTPLFGLETRRAVRDFDLLGITLQSELTFTNVLQVLHSSQIPMFSHERNENDPIVMAGGPCATNPLPLMPFIDVFFLGEAEDAIIEIAEVLKRYPTRNERLKQLKEIEGCWVPEYLGFDTSRVETEHSSVKESSSAACADETSAILSSRVQQGNEVGFDTSRVETERSSVDESSSAACADETSAILRPTIRARKYADFHTMDKLHSPQLLSWQLATHNRYVSEIMRGCSRGCRFCHAGYFYRPVRERNSEDILQELIREVRASGWDEAGLISLSSSDYTCIRELMFSLLKAVNTSKTHVSLPSLRVDSLDDALVSLMQSLGREGLTIAPEAGSQRLRDIINKNLTEEEILRGVEIALSLSWQKIKLYFMIGLPEETDEDIVSIINLIDKINTLGKRRLNINVTLSPFTPKPFTPFQWCAMLDPETLLARARRVKEHFHRGKNVRIKYHTIENSLLEACITRGDEDMARVIYSAWQIGAVFDAWNENWDFSKWEKAFEETGIQPSRYLGKKNPEAELPWDFIDIGVCKEFLLREYEKSLKGELSRDCRDLCSLCGACDDRAQTVSADSPKPLALDPAPIHAQKEYNIQIQYRYRIGYQKTGLLRFISHLDWMRMLFRRIAVLELPTVFTMGFSPHPKVSLSPPLPVGVESMAEYFDISFYEEFSAEQILREFQLTQIPDFVLTDCVRIGKDALIPSVESLEIELPEDMISGIPERIAEFNARESRIYTKQTEKRCKSYELKDIILKMQLSGNNLRVEKKLESPSLYDVLEAVLDIPKSALYRATVVRISLT